MKATASLLAAVLLTGAAQAGPIPVDPLAIPESPDQGWWFRVTPYGWLAAVDGDVRVGPLTAPVDISLSDTLEDIDMVGMAMFEAGFGRWSIGTDLVYAKSSFDLAGGGRIFDSFRYEQKQWLITPTIAYELIDTGRFDLSVLAGTRITVLEAGLTGRFVGGGQTTRTASTSWVDPLVGLRGQLDLSDQWFVRYNGDIGGFGASSDLIWQAYAGLGYSFSDCCAIALGYRGLGIDYEKDSFALDTISHGPVLGLEFRF